MIVTEAEAIRAYGEDGVKTYSTQFTPMYHAVTERKVPSRMKLICRKEDEKVLGLHIMGQVSLGFITVCCCFCSMRVAYLLIE